MIEELWRDFRRRGGVILMVPHLILSFLMCRLYTYGDLGHISEKKRAKRLGNVISKRT